MNLIEAMRRSKETGERFRRPTSEYSVGTNTMEQARGIVLWIDDILADDWGPVPPAIAVSNVTVMEERGQAVVPATNLLVGQVVVVNGLFGPCYATVREIGDGKAVATTGNGTRCYLDQQQDGSWWCQQMIAKELFEAFANAADEPTGDVAKESAAILARAKPSEATITPPACFGEVHIVPAGAPTCVCGKVRAADEPTVIDPPPESE